jgi:hypothetical protein
MFRFPTENLTELKSRLEMNDKAYLRLTSMRTDMRTPSIPDLLLFTMWQNPVDAGFCLTAGDVGLQTIYIPKSRNIQPHEFTSH